MSEGARLGPFHLGPEIGRGGMGIVHRAIRPGDPRAWAVKLARSVEDPGAAANEVQAAARLSHPHIVGVEAWGTVDGRLWVAMPFIGGRPASRCLRTLPRAGLWRIFDQLLDALGYAHDRGVVHRDLKPDNVLVESPDGPQPHAWLMDFGIAALAPPMTVGAVAAADGRSGWTPGTPAYMAPEQARGSEVGPEADLYAVGVMLYGALTGRLPFEGAPLDVLVAKMRQDAPPLSARADRPVNPALVALVARLLARHPLDRFASAAEVRRRLAEATAPESATFDPGPAGEPVATEEAWVFDAVASGAPPAEPTVLDVERPLAPNAVAERIAALAATVELAGTALSAVLPVELGGTLAERVAAWQHHMPGAARWGVLAADSPEALSPRGREGRNVFTRTVAGWLSRVRAESRAAGQGMLVETPVVRAAVRLVNADGSGEAARVPVPDAPLDGAAILLELMAFLATSGPVLWLLELDGPEAGIGRIVDFLETARERLRSYPVLMVALRQTAGDVVAPATSPRDAPATEPDDEALEAMLGQPLMEALRSAALLGPASPAHLLEHVGVTPTLTRRLCDLGVLRADGPPAGRGPSVVRFAGERGRRALAAGAPESMARRVHRAAAEWYEERGPALDAAERNRLARHWDAAGEPRRGLGWLYRAGRRAEVEGALNEAMRRFLEVLERDAPAAGEPDRPETVDRAGLRLAVARVSYELGDMSEALRWATLATTATERPLVAADAHRLLAEVHRARGAHGLALEHVEAGLRRLEPGGDRILRALLLGRRGWLAGYVMGRHAEGREDVERAFALIEGLDVPAVAAQMCSHLGAIELRAGRWDAQLAANERGLRMSEAAGDVAGRVRAHVNLGVSHHNRGNFALAIEHTTAAARLAELAGAATRRVIALNNLGLIFLDLRRFEDAVDALEACVALSHACGTTDMLFETCGALARIALQTGAFEAARHWARESERWAESTDSPLACAHADRIGAMVEQASGRTDAAEARLRHAIALTGPTDAYETCLSRLALAHLLGEPTDDDEATLRTFGAKPELERARWVTSPSFSKRSPSRPR